MLVECRRAATPRGPQGRCSQVLMTPATTLRAAAAMAATLPLTLTPQAPATNGATVAAAAAVAEESAR
jgi:hypothetical protein